MEQKQDLYDVLIVGAGPIGLACGIEATKKKLRYLIIEKGCLVNSIFHYPTNMTFFSTSDRLEIGNVPFISHGNKPTRREALEYYRRVSGNWKLNVHIYEKVLDIQDMAKNFKVITEKSSYLAKTCIIASGYYDNPNLLHVPGENLPKVRHYYGEPHPYAFRNVAVIGAGNSAVDVALELFRVGAKVTMIVREPALKDGIKYWVKPDIENRINEGSIDAYFNSTVHEISETEIIFDTPSGRKRIINDFVLAMTGYHPDFEFLKKVGIASKKDKLLTPVYDSVSYETNRPGLYLAGVVCGGMETSKLFIENSREHAGAIFQHIKKTYL
ncbi:MAG: YpdA family putative bacillithiol disulfide reductase [bacterium]|nr:MAG: YpdA family putative bacillithiol disulfide reductase [bacterium]